MREEKGEKLIDWSIDWFKKDKKEDKLSNRRGEGQIMLEIEERERGRVIDPNPFSLSCSGQCLLTLRGVPSPTSLTTFSCSRLPCPPRSPYSVAYFAQDYQVLPGGLWRVALISSPFSMPLLMVLSRCLLSLDCLTFSLPPFLPSLWFLTVPLPWLPTTRSMSNTVLGSQIQLHERRGG